MSTADDLLPTLRRLGLIDRDETPVLTPLAGGVSSDIWRVEGSRGPFCVKRALAKLKVAADWRAPVSRNANEVGWIEVAQSIVPGSAPGILGHDSDAGLFAMAWLPPERFQLWKAMLRAGIADPRHAAAVGRTIGRIHAATADNQTLARRFNTDAIFMPIRLEAYLVATGRAHPDLESHFTDLVARTLANKRALVHGDVSPKNILIGPDGPVFLDAECAWYGDPAFDAAFCLNHLLLKCLWNPGARDRFLASFAAFANAWLAEVTWEPAAEPEARAATLLPALTLARIDGKSPVEYLSAPADQSFVREAARALIASGATTLKAVCDAWRVALEARDD